MIGPIFLCGKFVDSAGIFIARFGEMAHWQAMNLTVRKFYLCAAVFLPSIFFVFLAPEWGIAYGTARVVDCFTKKPIKGAVIVSGNDLQETDEDGLFYTGAGINRIAARAHGYLRTEQTVIFSQVVKLVPFAPKALYLSFYGIGSRKLRESALDLVRGTELNSLVIDVKGDKGMISFKSSIPLATEVDAQRVITVKDAGSIMRSLKENGVYTIARIVTFKDNPLALRRTDLAVKTPAGEVWRDREGLAWVDPFSKEVWEYNIEIAVEAARHGFDEIQFDYVRFPDANGLRFSMPNTQENRVKAISGFLREAKNRLFPYNVFLAADIFGYVSWNQNDTDIGQRLEDITPHVDYLSLMLYPSGFHFGIPGYRNPVANPREVVYRSLRRAQERTGLPPVRFRPWLQAFRDYAFDRRGFSGKEIKDQISAVEQFGSDGWMLWNPRNVYGADGLRRE